METTFHQVGVTNCYHFNSPKVDHRGPQTQEAESAILQAFSEVTLFFPFQVKTHFYFLLILFNQGSTTFEFLTFDIDQPSHYFYLFIQGNMSGSSLGFETVTLLLKNSC